MSLRSGLSPALFLLTVPASLVAQQTPAASVAATAEPAKSVAAPATPTASTPLPSAPCTRCIPALTQIVLALDADLGSKISKTGDTFAFHLAQPIVIDGAEVVPAGTPGQGEVIHAKKAGGSGTAGELVLAARYLTVGSRQLRLRSLRVGDKSVDAIGKIDAFNAATVMSPVPVALLGFAMTGHNSIFAKGTLALAKTAEAFDLAAAATGPAPTDQTAQQASPPDSAQSKEKQDEKGSDKSRADPAGGHGSGLAGTGG